MNSTTGADLLMKGRGDPWNYLRETLPRSSSHVLCKVFVDLLRQSVKSPLFGTSYGLTWMTAGRAGRVDLESVS